MDFIERIFGVDPDGGSGASETLLVMVALGLVILVFRYRTKRRATDRQSS